MRPFSVVVSGSSANLGSGFDSLAIALDCELRVDLTYATRPGVQDIGSPDLLGGSNLVVDAMQFAARRHRLTLPGCSILVSGNIPVARGLGSSAAAIVAGIVVAGIAAGRPFSDAEIIDLGGSLEGHADNVSASVLGGITVSIRASHAWIAEVVAADIPWTPVMFIPDAHAFTSEARALLPAELPMPDVVSNVGRAALATYAFHASRGDLLREAMIDRIHQPYRAAIFRHLEPCIQAALDAGAVGACLSGAGPAVLAFAPNDRAEDAGKAMQRVGLEHGVPGVSRCMFVPARGLRVLTHCD